MIFPLLITSVVIIACILTNKITSRVGMPALLAFIVLGMFFGSDGLLKIPFENFAFAEQICSVALIFIMFYGGFGTKWKTARPVAVPAILLSSVGVLMTAGLTGLFGYLVLGMNLLESLLLGAVLGSTDAASVFSILRSKNLNLKYNTASLLELESGSNDPGAYMMTVILLSLLQGRQAGGSVVYMVFAQVFFGAFFGVVIAFAAVWFMKHVHFVTEGFDAAFVIAVALLSYAAPQVLGGNGYLSVYIVGIILGNQTIHNKRSLVNFFDGITSLLQMLIFFLLGLLAFPSRMPAVFLPAAAIALFLTFIGRPLVTWVILTPFQAKMPQQVIVSWAGLRGAASIVFAVMVTVSGVSLEHDLFHMVFCVVLFSIGVQGSLLPWLSKKLEMIDMEGTVMKTFNDYNEEKEIQFIQLEMKEGHPWIGKEVKGVELPPDTLLVMLLRGHETLIPKGNTQIEQDDIVVLSANAYEDESTICLMEIAVDTTHEWCDHKVSELELPADTLIIMIRRDGQAIIPGGMTEILDGDVLVVNENQSVDE